MSNVNIKTATPVASTDVAAGDRLVVGDVTADGWVAIEAEDLLDALLRVAAAADVLLLDGTAGKVVVRQRGGVAGTDEVQISHDGTDGTVESKSGELYLRAGGANLVRVGPTGDRVYVNTPWFSNSGFYWIFNNNATGPVLVFGKDVGLSWTSGVYAYLPTQDIGLLRSAAKVVKFTDGSTGGGTLSSPALTPAQITGSTNNYAPGTGRYVRVSSDGAYDLTGLTAGVDGQEVFLCNVGANTLTLKHQDAASTAANRFLFSTGADVSLTADKTVRLWYDATTQRWRDC